ncbi:MAG: hypothetical protein Tsb002_27230 [Wenzhouxiangellaceae bacterium]
MLVMVTALPIQAQEQTPRSVAENYMTAVSNGNWPRAAAQMHPQSLAVIHQLFIDTYENSPDPAALSRLYGVKDLQAFRDLAPEDFFVRFMNAVLGQDPSFNEAIQHLHFDVVDEQSLGDSQVLIHYNITLDSGGEGIGDTQISDTDTLTLRRSSQGWKIYSTPDLEPLLERAGEGQ